MIDTAPRRAGLVLAAGALAALPANPLVRLEAVLGLSPAPLERYLGIKSVFSGMTEGMHWLVHGELARALDANCLTPLVALAVLYWAATGMRIRTRKQECWAGAAFIGLSAMINLVHPVI